MPCVCWNGRIIRCAEGNRVSHDVQKTILHPVFRGIVYEHVEAFAAGPHVHACQSHSSPRLIAESPFVDPPAVDGRQTIDDASTDCEFRVGGQFREMNRGYGKLFRHPTAVRRGVGEFRVAKHLRLPATRNKQAETAGRERDDAHVGERTERFRDGLIRRRVVLLSTAGELDVAVDRDDASDATQSEAVGCIWRFPLLGYGKLFHRPAAADAEIVSAVHAAADCDLAVRVEGQGSMLLVHTFQQYRAFIFRQETGVHRLMHNLAVGIDVGCEGRVAKSERHHADFGEMYRHAVWPMPDLPFKGYGKLLKMDFHDSTCDNNFRTDEQIDCPIRCNRYLDRTLQV